MQICEMHGRNRRAVRPEVNAAMRHHRQTQKGLLPRDGAQVLSSLRDRTTELNGGPMNGGMTNSGYGSDFRIV